MRIKQFKRIQEGEYQEAPDYFKRVMQTVNDQFESLTQAASNLGIVDNGNNEELEIALEDDQFLEIALRKVRGKPRGAILIDNGTTGYARLAFSVLNQSTLLVKVKWDTDPGRPTTVRILVFGT